MMRKGDREGGREVTMEETRETMDAVWGGGGKRGGRNEGGGGWGGRRQDSDNG